jgi:hypothetical protein
MYLPSHKDPLGENTFRQENMETVSASLRTALGILRSSGMNSRMNFPWAQSNDWLLGM